MMKRKIIAGDGGGDDDMTTYRIGRGRTMPPQSYRRRMKGEPVGAAAARIAVAASVFCWRGRRHGGDGEVFCVYVVS